MFITKNRNPKTSIALVIGCLALGTATNAQTITSCDTTTSPWVSTAEAPLQWMGRHAVVGSQVHFDWPAVRASARLEGSWIELQFQGEGLLRVDGDGKEIAKIDIATKRCIRVNFSESDRHRVDVWKVSENQTAVSQFVAVRVGNAPASLLNAPPPRPEQKVRQIEFLGDSYSAGFGNLSPSRDPLPGQNSDSLLYYGSDALQSFPALVSNALGAEFHLLAFSGRGLVRNYNGIAPGLEFGDFLDQALVSSRNTKGPSVPWTSPASWKPQIVVIGLGINDYQGDPTKVAPDQFRKAYAQLLERYRKMYPGVRFLLCATQIWPEDALIPQVRLLAQEQAQAGHSDIEVFEYGADRTGLYWHPSAADHRNIAQQMRPVLMKLGKWQSR